jgi:hypothetical protein
MLNENYCAHCGQSISGEHLARATGMQDIGELKEKVDTVLILADQLRAALNQVALVKEACEGMQQTMRQCAPGPLFDRLNVDLHEIESRVSSLEYAVNKKTIRARTSNK